MTDSKYDGACMRLSKIGYKMTVDKDTFMTDERVIYDCKVGHTTNISLATMNNTYRKSIVDEVPFCATCRKTGLSLEDTDRLSAKETKEIKKKSKKKSEESSLSENSIDTIESILEEDKNDEYILSRCSAILKDMYSLSYKKLSDKKEFDYNFAYQFNQENHYKDTKDDIIQQAKNFPKILRKMSKKFKIDGIDKSYIYKIMLEFISSGYNCAQSRKMLKFLFERTKYEENFMIFEYQQKVIDKLKEDRKLSVTDIQTGISDGCPVLEYTYEDNKSYWYPDVYIPKENKIIDVYNKLVYEKFKNRIDARLKQNKKYVEIELWIEDGGNFEVY